MLTKIYKITLKYTIFLIFTFVLSNEILCQTDREFWFAAPDFTSGHCAGGTCPGDEPIYLRFATFDVEATVRVELPAYNGGAGYLIEEFTMGIQDYYSIDLSAIKALIETTHPINPLPYETGIHITSTNLISAYYEFDSFYNQEIFALKGKNALGKKFIAPFQNMYRNDWAGYDPDPLSTINIVATQDATQIRITLSNADMEGHVASDVFDIFLDEGETYVVKANVAAAAGHLGGTIIEVIAGGDIAVTIDDDSVFNDVGTCRDAVGDQIVPTDVTGKEYIIMRGPLPTTERAFIYPIDDNTEIEVNGVSIGFYDILNPAVVVIPLGSEAIHIKGDTSLYVFHVSGMSCEIGGALLPTIDGCTGSLQVTYYRSNTNDFWLFLMTKAGNEDSFVFEYADGSSFNLPSTWFTAIGTTGWMVLKNANYKFANALGGGFPQGQATKIINTKDVFHMGVLNGKTNTTFKYGYFSDFVQETVSGKVVQSSSAFGEVCENNPLQLFASGGKSYSWFPVDYLDDPTSATPWATLPAGPHSYKVTIERPCTGDTILNMSINSIPVPNASFTLSDYSVCAPFNLELYNNSDLVSTQQNWNFNYDNNPFVFDLVTSDPVDTITHWFYNNTNTDTTFNIRLLTRQTGNPCVDTFFNQIHVKPEIYAGFDQDNLIGCNPLLVQFTDTSSGNLDKYKWTFGDGGQETIPSPDHEYKHVFINDTRDYDVELVVTSPYFCKDTAIATISVFPYLEGGFTIDDDEGCSPYDVRIENISSGADSIFLEYGDGQIDTLTPPYSSVNHWYMNNDGIDEVDTNTIVMRVKNDEGCEFIDRDTIIVFPEFIADYTIDPYNDCNSDTVTFINNTIDGIHLASRYLWDFDDGSSMDTTNNTIDKFYNNTTSADKTYNFRLTARSIYGCTDEITGVIDMYRAYADFTVNNNEGCSPLVVAVNNISIGDNIGAGGWYWDYYDDGLQTDNVEDPFPYTYNNTGFENDTNKLVLEVTGTLGCSTRDSIYIIVYSSPEVTFTFDDTTGLSCDSLVVDFTPVLGNPLLPIDTIWDFGDGSSSSEPNPQHVYKNLLSSTAKPYSVSLRVETDLGCFDEHDAIITVNPMVRSTIFIDQASGCSPITVDAIAQTFLGINFYNWDYGDGSTITNDNPPPYPYSSNNSYEPFPAVGGDAEYYLRLDVVGSAGVCTDSDSVLITVFPEIVADYIPQGVIDCNPFEVTFTDQSTLNVDSWYWNFGDGTSSSLNDTTHTFINATAGTQPFNVSLDVVSKDGCTDNTIAQISVLPQVVADFDIDISAECSPLEVQFTDNSIGVNYKWYWDDNSVTPDSIIGTSFFKEFYNSTGVDSTYTIKLVVDNGLGCKDSISRDITVYSSLIAGFTFNQPDSCVDSDVTFTDITIPAVGGYNYSWDFNDGSFSTTTASSFIKTFSNGKTIDYDYHVGLTVESPRGCTSFYTEDVTVYSKVVADFSIPLTAKCPPFENAVIVNNSFGDNLNKYEWYVDNSATPDQTIIGTGDFIRTYDNTDHLNVRPYPIRLLAYNSHGCTSEISDVINVYEYVEADFSIDIDKDCNPLEAQFTDNSLVPVGTIYSWDFNDGASSGDVEPSHDFFNTSRTDSISRTVYLSVESPNFCENNTSMQVTIYHNPLAKFFIDRTSSCPLLESALIKESLGEDSFEWRFGDLKPNNTTEANLTYSWDNTDINNIKTYNLELWVGTDRNCVDSTSLDLTVFPRVTADFLIDNAVGCSPLEGVNFTNTSSSPATQFFWTFGDGTASNLKSPSHDFINIGSNDRSYNVYLRASTEYDCWDDTSQQITVYVQPDAEFYINPKLMVYPNNVVNLTNLTNFGPFEYNWSFGNLNNSSSALDQPNTFEYEHWGEKIISLEVNSTSDGNCTDTYIDTLLILPPLVNADFTMDIEATCLNDNEEITFTAFPVIVYGDEYEYEWDFGDDTGTETGEVVYHTYNSAGLFFIKLVARSTEIGREDEEDFVYKPVRIYANPIANIEVSPKISMLNSDLEARVEFFNLSECSDTSGCSYVWDFGDGSTAISKDVTHYYTEIGVYDVSLLVTTASGCKDSILLEDEVSIIGEGDIKFPNAFTPNGDGLNDTFKPVSKGVISYEMYIYNRWGELIFTTKDLDAGWNGKMNGDYAKPDVYVWKAEGKFTNGRSFELAGDITLIR
ncbi:MAG: PKD domain-containing protein [Bacteroidales bacterium]|nr:PKD domain-containing protein [Bacteroidales bacterium]